MSNITVTQERIDHLMETADITVKTSYDKITVVIARLENGFCISASSGCVDPANYDVEIGKKSCLRQIRDKLWELEGYVLQKEEYDKRRKDENGKAAEPIQHSYDFGDALRFLWDGKKLYRRGWNGRGIYIAMQIPDSGSQNTLPYLYIVTNNLLSQNPDAPRGRVPWFPSQTDMLATDWEVTG